MPDPTKKTEHEQLLTAYLDGELDQIQRAEVESLIATHPEYGELLENWRRNGDALRALPRLELGDRFAAKVLSALDRQDPEKIEDDAHVVNATKHSNRESVSEWRIGLTAIIALAAMLLVVLFVAPNVSDVPMTAMNDEAKDLETKAKDHGEKIAGEVLPNVELDSDSVESAASEAPAFATAPVKSNDRAKQPLLSEFLDLAETLGRRKASRKSVGDDKRKPNKLAFRDSQSLDLQSGGARLGGRLANKSLAKGSDNLPAQELRELRPRIDRVLVLSLNESQKSITDVEKVLQANSIDFTRQRAAEEDADAEAGRPVSGSSQFRLSLEAFYIVAAKAKIKQATQDLAEQNIRINLLSLPPDGLADLSGVGGSLKPSATRNWSSGKSSPASIAAKKDRFLARDFAKKLRPIQLDLEDKSNDLFEFGSAVTDQAVGVLLLISPQSSESFSGRLQAGEASEKQ